MNANLGGYGAGITSSVTPDFNKVIIISSGTANTRDTYTFMSLIKIPSNASIYGSFGLSGSCSINRSHIGAIKLADNAINIQ